VGEWLSAQGSALREREPEMKEATAACPESLDLVRLRSLQVARDKFHQRVKPWSFTDNYKEFSCRFCFDLVKYFIIISK